MENDYCLVSGISVDDAAEMLMYFDVLDTEFLKYLAHWIPNDYLDDENKNRLLYRKIARLFRFGEEETHINNDKFISYSISDDMIRYIKIGKSCDMLPIVELTRGLV